MFCVLSGLCLAAFLTGASCDKVAKFNCDFDDADYNLETEFIFGPVFGNVTVQPMNFSSNDDFALLLAVIEKNLEDIMDSYPLNDLDELIQFYNKYSTLDQTGMNMDRFKQFLKDYEPTFLPKTVSYTFNIEILDRLTAYDPNVASHVFLSTATGVYQKSLIDKILSLEEVPSYFVHTHSAAILRFSLKNKLGHIVMDPGNGISVPVVVMDDGDIEWPQHDTIRASDVQNLHFSLVDASSPKYIIASTFINGEQSPYDEVKLYFVGKPYCSPLKSNTKFRLVKTYRSIVKLNSQGMRRAGLFFDMTEQMQVLTVVLYRKDGRDNKVEEINLTTPLETQNTEVFEKVLRIVGIDKEQLMKKLEDVQKIANDKTFLRLSNKMERTLHKTVSKLAKTPSEEQYFSCDSDLEEEYESDDDYDKFNYFTSSSDDDSDDDNDDDEGEEEKSERQSDNDEHLITDDEDHANDFFRNIL